MDRKKLLIVGGLIGIVLVLGVFIIIPSIMGTDEDSYTNSSREDFIFDNLTPEAIAISIARLNEGVGFEDGTKDSVFSIPGGNYWIVMNHDGFSGVIIVDTKTLKSKVNFGEWKSLDELKASYIAEIYCGDGDVAPGKPYKVNLDGKTIWKVPCYDYYSNRNEICGYVYVDTITGKSKSVMMGTGKWMTLKELDESINEIYNLASPFRNTLRDFYPE